MRIKSIRQAKNLRGKRVFLRADFNVPIEKGKIKDDYRIIAGLPTIRFLLRYKCRIIIATHLGRPLQNKKNKKYYSTKPIAVRLGKLLGKKVKFFDDCVGAKVEKEISKMKEGDILFLENLRFYKEEENNDKKFAKNLASLADIYINDAFAVSHRENASIGAIKKYLPAYAGLALEAEIENLSKALKPKKPLAVVIGGAKIETKISLLKKMKKKSKMDFGRRRHS
jgi:phosphoglycerate kinase